MNIPIVFSLPEDNTSDIINVYSSTTETGTYTLIGSEDYDYGSTSFMIEDIDEALWYKISFESTSTGYQSALSDPIFGGDFTARSTPFARVSTTFDGINYASVSEVYTMSNLTIAECPVNTTQTILRSVRAYIDIRLGELNLNTYRFGYNDDVSRRKYNGHLRITRDIEINLTISAIMDKLASDSQLEYARLDDKIDDPYLAKTITTVIDRDIQVTTTGATTPTPSTVPGQTGGLKSVNIGPSTVTYDLTAVSNQVVVTNNQSQGTEGDETITVTGDMFMDNDGPDKRGARLAKRIEIFSKLALDYKERANSLFKTIIPNSIDIYYGTSSRYQFPRPLTVDSTFPSWGLDGYNYNTMPI